MLHTITGPTENARLSKEFEGYLSGFPGAEKRSIHVTTRGEPYPRPLHEAVYLPTVDVWYIPDTRLDQGSWRPFGIGVPKAPPEVNDVTIQLNFPVDGRLNNHARFARDSDGEIVVLSTGPAGGRVGIGKGSFLSSSYASSVTAHEVNSQKEFAFVGRMGPGLVQDVAAFVKAVQAFRDSVPKA
jgi:hypothetical protein